jgi:hypothetical protein
MNRVVLREFKLFFGNEDEAMSRASDYMNSDFRKSSDRRNVMIGGAIGGVAAAAGYVLEYLLGLPSDSHVGKSVTFGGLVAAMMFLPKRQADAARRYLRERYKSQAMEGR